MASSAANLDHQLVKRTTDDGTLGGNAYSGNSGDVDGGDVVNKSNNFGMPTLMNMNSNNAGAGGGSLSGCSNGGHGNGRGAGGNSYSGSSGNAEGGSVWNSGGVMNVDSSECTLLLLRDASILIHIHQTTPVVLVPRKLDVLLAVM